MQQQWRRSGRRKDRMKLNLPPKLVEKLVWVPVLSFCKIFIPSYTFDALLCRNWPISPPNHVSIQITLITTQFLNRVLFLKFVMQLHWLNSKNPEAIWFVTHQLECLPETDYEVFSFTITSVACAVGPSVPCPQLIFPSKSQLFGIYLNFQQQKSLKI